MLDRRVFVAIWICLLIGLSASASESDYGVPVDALLTTPPLPISSALFSEKTDPSEIINADHLKRSILWPKASSRVHWLSDAAFSFREIHAEKGVIRFKAPERDKQAHVAYAFFYVESKRYQNFHFEIASSLPFGLFIDGERELIQDTSSQEKMMKTCDVSLKRGKHRVLLKSFRPRDIDMTDWYLEIRLTSQFENSAKTTTDPQRQLYRYDDSRFIHSIADLVISPDGATAAIVLRSRGDGFEPRTTYIELWDLKSNSMRSTLSRARTTDTPLFSPDSRYLVFRTIDDGTNLWIMEIQTGRTRALLREGTSLSDLSFSPDGEILFFLQDVDEDGENGEPYKRYAELRDKLTDWRTDRAVCALSVESGAKWRLTSTGDFSIRTFSLSPNGERIAYWRMVPIDRRPFFKSELWIQEIGTGEGKKVAELTTGFENYPLNLAFSPDGRRLAFTSTPDTVGNATQKEHNIYNSDLYVLDLPTGNIAKVTEGFAPSVVERTARKSVAWSKGGDALYFLAVDRSRRRIFRAPIPRDLKTPESRQIEPAVRDENDIAFFSNVTKNGSFLFSASSYAHPSAAYLHRGRGEASLVCDPNESLFKRLSLGSATRFDFTSRKGRQIDGWIFRPPHFDPAAKYPLIVYYYGGVSPRLERFTFMYHWLNANGYVVYALNPSGAYGAGDDLADLHVNDWGDIVSEEIIEGVEKVLEAHPFLDASRIGAFGGSYGGFITLDLVTKTDLFSAACSLFGISNITSYWGAGTWGFTYGDMALARSYPWKDFDIFIERSPLFHADRIRTPILLLHGDADVNVPPGESWQMFTALRVLGRDAALVEFSGQDHGISGSFEALVEHREIMLEWFDKYLIGEGEAWEARWK